MKAQGHPNPKRVADIFTVTWTKEAVATVLAISALMLTPLLDGVYIFGFAALAIVLYGLVFRRHLSAGEINAMAIAFTVAFIVAIVLAL